MTTMKSNKPKGMKKKTLGSTRARIGLPTKAGRRRPTSLVSVRDKYGSRNFFAAEKQITSPQRKAAETAKRVAATEQAHKYAASDYYHVGGGSYPGLA